MLLFNQYNVGTDIKACHITSLSLSKTWIITFVSVKHSYTDQTKLPDYKSFNLKFHISSQNWCYPLNKCPEEFI